MKSMHFLIYCFVLFIILSCSSDKYKPIDFDLGKPLLTEKEKTEKKLTPEVLWKLGRLGEMDLSPDEGKIIYTVKYYSVKNNSGNASLFIKDINSDQALRLTDTSGSEFNPRFHPGGNVIGFLSTKSGSAQIWEMDYNGQNLKKISDVEGGINSFEYSPTGDKIMYMKDVKLDPSVNDLYPDLPKANLRIFDELMYRHWDDWHDYKYSHIFVADYNQEVITGGKDIMEGERYDSPLPPYFSSDQITWSVDGQKIAYTSKKMSRDEFAVSTNSDIYIYDLSTDQTINISSENKGYDRYPSFSPDGNYIAWQSMKTPGYEADKERLFVMDLKTMKIKYLTENFDQNVGALRWSHNNNDIYFISGTRATYQVYKINLFSKEINKLTSGVHNYQDIVVGKNFILGKKMSMSMASEIYKIRLDNGEDELISNINNEIYSNIDLGKVEERIVKTTNGEDMLVWVIYPPDFDQEKKYPALLYCQGGPQSAVSQFFSFRWNFQIMAASGYIIVAPNRHGLPTFGQKWNDQIVGDYGGQNMKDYLQAIDVVSEEPFIDEERLGAVGASYGGYSVYYLAGIHKGRFKALISHCGIFNLESMYAATEETFFPNHDMEGAFWNKPKPKSYNYSPHLLVQNWDAPILVIVGEYDFRIPYSQSLQAFNAAKLRGVPARLLYFNDEDHWITKPQNSIIWQREFFGWLDKYLK